MQLLSTALIISTLSIPTTASAEWLDGIQNGTIVGRNWK